MDDFVPTEEQYIIIDHLQKSTNNLLIRALAGSGKTATLLLSLRYTTANRVLFLAFNTRIKGAMEEKYKEATQAGTVLPPTQIRTFNSLGFQVWRNTCAHSVTVDPDKMRPILNGKIKELCKTSKAQKEAYDGWTEITSAIGLAKAYGYVPDGNFPDARRLIEADQFWSKLEENPTDLVEDLVDACMVASIKTAYLGNIDLNDQLYMPAVFGGTYPRFPLVLVDEDQDLNNVMFEMLRHMRESRIVGVGDDYQSIYAFRGAVQGGMQKMQEMFDMTPLELTVSFRCPENVVRNVWWRVPHMKWAKEGGTVERLGYADPSTFVDYGAIICRNNAPLFSVAFKLLASGRNVNVSGTDIGTRVITILEKLGDDTMTREQLLNAIEQWRVEKIAKQSKTADDTADCMKIFAEKGENLSQAVAYAKALFKQTGPLTLTTGHKAKGLEWEVVYHLDPYLIKEDEQDRNLRYVIQTRALREYYEINSTEIEFNVPAK